MELILFLILATIVGFIILYVVASTAQYKEIKQSVELDAINTVNKLATLLEQELLQWVKEPNFLPEEFGKISDYTDHDKNCGVKTFGVSALLIRKEVWLERAKIWLMKNSQANGIGIDKIIMMTCIMLMCRAISEKLGESELYLLQSRLMADYNEMNKEFHYLRPKSQFEEWWQDIDYWFDTYKTEMMNLGIDPLAFYDRDDRFSKRNLWIREQVSKRPHAKYSLICKEALTINVD